MALDTAKRVVFGNYPITPEELHLTDSLLMAAVDYYNTRVSRKELLIFLRDDEYIDFLRADSTLHALQPYFRKNGKPRKRKMAHDRSSAKLLWHDPVRAYDSLTAACKAYREAGHQGNDSLVWAWGARDVIDMADYYRQYKVEKQRVYVTCFCSEIKNNLDHVPHARGDTWKHAEIVIHDGGSSAFTLTIDLDAKKAEKMRVNGIR